MGLLLTAFKAYDLRGEFGVDLTPELAGMTAHAMVIHLHGTSSADCLTIAVGHDMRSHSPVLYEAVCAGIRDAGANVLEIGLTSTPMFYFAVRDQKADGGIMVTASHNPAKDNGLKLCREDAIPLAGGSPDSDLEQIKQHVIDRNLIPAPHRGSQRTFDAASAYRKTILAMAQDDKQLGNTTANRRFRIVADYANGMGSVEAAMLKELFDIVELYPELDGTFPNHSANPLDHNNLADVSQAVRQEAADFGLAFDGDADRVGFVDETGTIVPMDLITALIAQWYLKRNSGNVLHDLRSSRATIETIQEYGGTPISCRVGHSFVKQQMRVHNGIFGGELAGHFYFQELGNVESTALAVIRIAGLMRETQKTLSALAAPLRRYANSGELNLELPVRDEAKLAIARLEAAYPDAQVSHLDGILLQTKNWWCNVRPSNTEPRLRIVIEAQDQNMLDSLTTKIMTTLQCSETMP